MNQNLKPDIYLIGAGGHAKSCIDVIELENKYTIKGLFGFDYQIGNKILDYDIIDIIDNSKKYSKKDNFFLITIGLIDNKNTRKLFYQENKNFLNFTSIISPRSHLAKYTKIGKGVIIMHDVVINTNSVIGDNCIINSKALVEHDVLISDHCHISTSAVINGSVKIGQNSFIGSNSTIKQQINLEDNTFIPMGSRITNNNSKYIYKSYEDE